MVYRIYVEKKPGLSPEASSLLADLKNFLGIENLTDVRVLNRYDVDQIDAAVYEQAKPIVFAEPQVDVTYDEVFPLPEGNHTVLAVEALPGQFDQRADSAAQCIQLMAGVERPLVTYARVYVLMGKLSEEEMAKIRHHLINPVECREAGLEKPETLVHTYEVPQAVATLDGFTALDEAGLAALLDDLGLAMDLDDLKFLQAYFKDEEKRDPTITEVRVVDTYWSDHCRHTTFSTHLDEIAIEDAETKAAYERYLAARVEVYGEEKAAARPQTLMDIATLGTKTLKKRGVLTALDESEEINACSIKITADVDGEEQDWLLMFKNETHNHPTEIEPFGGAATCIGGCIRDPLSGRAYVHQAMRLTGCGDPRVPMDQTLPGKLPQRKIATTATAGYSSYGNQIGLATGIVNELYHPGYVAKHMEVGAVVAAAPVENVRRERPAPGDVVILLGGRTGRDGIGGATGSSKSHNQKSLTTMASEVQKGNAPEERKIQRLFRDGNVTRLIKRCNDFGAGGVSVSIGELADGLTIDLDAVRKKYDGLDGTELAISESQERMSVVVAAEDVDKFIAAADKENLEAYPVAVITEEERMVMTWKGQTIANLSRAFLNTNGAAKHTTVQVKDASAQTGTAEGTPDLRAIATDLNLALQRGLAERFDGTIGAGSILMPFGGITQRTPAQVMAATLPVDPGKHTDTGSIFSWGFRPKWMERDPYTGAAASVVDSMAKLVAAGGDPSKAYLTLQEYFEKLRDEPLRWGKPFAALLGALDAQLSLGVAAIGGKDSMSGSFLDLDVPPTLISFAITPVKAGHVLSPEFKEAGHPVYLFPAGTLTADGMKQTRTMWQSFMDLCLTGAVKAAWAVGEGGVAEAVMKMSYGNRIGFAADADPALFSCCTPGTIVAELNSEADLSNATLLGHTTADALITIGTESVAVEELLNLSESVLEGVYPTRTDETGNVEPISYTGGPTVVCGHKMAAPKAVIPVFPGTNCEYDTARACLEAGIEPQIVVVKNLTRSALEQSAEELENAIRGSQIMIVPGGFSGGDEPDGSAKFICSFLRNARLTDAVHDLLKNRDGLLLGICNGFQALVKLGLVPYGEIRDMDDSCATLTYNTIGRHQSSIVRTRVCTNKSPWLLNTQVGEVYNVPISHGEGRFIAPDGLLKQLAENGQIATQYVDLSGAPSMDTAFNPNGSLWAIEGITSPDGRVLGKMGHSERVGKALYKNVPGCYNMQLFNSAAEYFK